MIDGQGFVDFNRSFPESASQGLDRSEWEASNLAARPHTLPASSRHHFILTNFMALRCPSRVICTAQIHLGNRRTQEKIAKTSVPST
jgi:hypothetical protein